MAPVLDGLIKVEEVPVMLNVILSLPATTCLQYQTHQKRDLFDMLIPSPAIWWRVNNQNTQVWFAFRCHGGRWFASWGKKCPKSIAICQKKQPRYNSLTLVHISYIISPLSYFLGKAGLVCLTIIILFCFMLRYFAETLTWLKSFTLLQFCPCTSTRFK